MVDRKLPDMSILPPKETYHPPDGGDDFVVPIDLGEGLSIVSANTIYRSWVVNFSISTYFEEDGTRYCLARIDCCWGTVHRHRFDRNGDDDLDHEVIHEIILDNTQWDQIDKLYIECYDRVIDEAVDNLRRWRDGR